VPPEIEKLMARTPSAIAWPTAAAESDEKQPCSPQTLYTATWAPGAMPWMAPRSIPSGFAWATGPPAAVVEVWVPWPLESRALSGYTSPPMTAL
jgi:hypothetical protein